MWRMAGSELVHHARWIRRHPVQAGLVLAVWLFGAVTVWLGWQPYFIDLDDYHLETATGWAELPETVGGVFALRLADGRRLYLLCDVDRGSRSRPVQGCIQHAYAAGLRPDEPVTVQYLRPPQNMRPSREGRDGPVLLSIEGRRGAYLSCRDRRRVLELSRPPLSEAVCA
jgi:hypothetical protein